MRELAEVWIGGLAGPGLRGWVHQRFENKPPSEIEKKLKNIKPK